MKHKTVRSHGRLIKTVKPHYDKVEMDVARSARVNLDEVSFLAIIEVKTEGYVPKGVALRTRITPLLFTARVEPGRLKLLQSDAEVLSIAPSQPLVRSAWPGSPN